MKKLKIYQTGLKNLALVKKSFLFKFKKSKEILAVEIKIKFKIIESEETNCHQKHFKQKKMD